MKTFTVAIVLAALSSLSGPFTSCRAEQIQTSNSTFLRGPSSSELEPKASGKAAFQLYLFAQTWLPRFCLGTSYPGCQEPLPVWNQAATIHGLWPEYDDESGSASNPGPFNCAQNYDSSLVDNEDLIEAWPNVKSGADPLSEEYHDFWEYQWNKHGSCSGLRQADYFRQVIALFNSFPTPAVLRENVGDSVPLTTLVNAYGGKGYVAFRCSGKQLQEIRTCWEKKPDNSVGKQVMCPAFVQSSCTSSLVVISSF